MFSPTTRAFSAWAGVNTPPPACAMPSTVMPAMMVGVWKALCFKKRAMEASSRKLAVLDGIHPRQTAAPH